MRYLRQLENFVKDWIIDRPSLANMADTLLIGRKRDIPVFTEILTMLNRDEREYLFRLAKDNNPEKGAIVEIGCYAGGSTYFLGKGAQLSGSHVYSVDPFNSHLKKQVQECDG